MERSYRLFFPSSRKSLTTEFLPLINTFHAIGGGGARKVGRNAQRWCYTFRKLNLPPDKFVGNFSPAHSRLQLLIDCRARHVSTTPNFFSRFFPRKFHFSTARKTAERERERSKRVLDRNGKIMARSSFKEDTLDIHRPLPRRSRPVLISFTGW